MSTATFHPVFLATLRDGHLWLLYPSTTASRVTGEAPDSFDGGGLYTSPPVYPCLIISGDRAPDGAHIVHVPNRVVRNREEYDAYGREWRARRPWRYENPDYADMQAAIDRNDQMRAENRARAEAAEKEHRRHATA